MPLKQGYTTRNGQRVGYYQWGDAGAKYTYTPGNAAERERAKEKAQRQGRAIEASKRGQ